MSSLSFTISDNGEVTVHGFLIILRSATCCLLRDWLSTEVTRFLFPVLGRAKSLSVRKKYIYKYKNFQAQFLTFGN